MSDGTWERLVAAHDYASSGPASEVPEHRPQAAILETLRAVVKHTDPLESELVGVISNSVVPFMTFARDSFGPLLPLTMSPAVEAAHDLPLRLRSV